MGPSPAEDQGEGPASPAGPETGAVPPRVRRRPGLDQRQGKKKRFINCPNAFQLGLVIIGWFQP